MKLKISTLDLYTDDNKFIKHMACPHRVQLNSLEVDSYSNSKQCSKCNNRIYDTQLMTDEEIVNLITEKPLACLNINFNQGNIQIVDIYGEYNAKN